MRFTYRIPEQENIWNAYRIISRRLLTIVDVPFKMDAEGRNVGDTSQYVILREALANFLMHADQFNGMSLSGVEKAVRNMKASGEIPMPKAYMSIAAFRMRHLHYMVHGGTTAERFAYEPGITQRPILDNYVSFRCL